jgi:transposase-like protein
MVKEQTISIVQLYEKYPDEASCEQELIRMRWPDGFVCPKCGYKKHYTVSTRRLKLFECTACHHQTTAITGTIFERSQTSLKKWFIAIRAIASGKTGYSAAQLSRDIGVAYQTAWTMCHKIRKAMGDRESSRVLTGIVQADESFIGGPDADGKRGRGSDKTKVFGIVQVDVDKKGDTHPAIIKFAVVDAINTKTVTEKINTWVQEGSIVYTDKLNVYAKLDRYTHIAEKSTKTNKYGHLGWYHVVVGNLQNLILGIHHGLESKHLQNYLDEFCWRFNKKNIRTDIFGHLLRQCVQSTPVSYAELIG